MRSLTLIAIMMASGTASAMPPRPVMPVMSDAEIRAELAPGQTIEVRVDGDMNGDGDSDTAFIVAGDDRRDLHVFLAARGEYDWSRERAGSFTLEPDALGPADLSVRNGVLIVRDLTGGTSALAVTYRFRGEKGMPQLRLIGLDAKAYSRTWAHDGAEMSWNLMTGDVIAAHLKLVGSGENATYEKTGARRFRRPVAPVFMDDTPNAEDELAAATKGL